MYAMGFGKILNFSASHAYYLLFGQANNFINRYCRICNLTVFAILIQIILKLIHNRILQIFYFVQIAPPSPAIEFVFNSKNRNEK